jgi:hypothetical protein
MYSPFTQNLWAFGLFPLSGILENTTFRKLDLFPSSGEGGGEDTYSVGPLRKSWSQSISITGLRLAHSKGPNWVGVFSPHLHLRTKTDPVSETSCSLECQTMEKVRKPTNSVCYTPSSEPFRIYSPFSFCTNPNLEVSVTEVMDLNLTRCVDIYPRFSVFLSVSRGICLWPVLS